MSLLSLFFKMHVDLGSAARPCRLQQLMLLLMLMEMQAAHNSFAQASVQHVFVSHSSLFNVEKESSRTALLLQGPEGPAAALLQWQQQQQQQLEQSEAAVSTPALKYNGSSICFRLFQQAVRNAALYAGACAQYNATGLLVLRRC
jgi:hypothetical protein